MTDAIQIIFMLAVMKSFRLIMRGRIFQIIFMGDWKMIGKTLFRGLIVFKGWMGQRFWRSDAEQALLR